jgi:ubiquinone/menaquinone biosynthesis C-methylase UbiE
MNIWDKKFYGKEEIYRKEIFRIPHKDLPRFVKLLRKIKAKKILDLGCGTGRHVIAMAKKGFEVYGVDISKKALNLAKERLKEEGLKAKLRVGDFYKKLPYKDKFFDGVISIKALHHARVFKIKKLIKEIERVMKPGGILMIEVPRKKKRHSSKKYKKIEPGTYVRLKGPEAGVPHYIFDKKELKKFFANFEILDIYITRDKIQSPSPHYTMFAKFKGTS